jgi:Protein of unknown function (DUF551)
MSEWISTKDRLPDCVGDEDCSANVLTTDGKNTYVMALFYDADGWMWANCYSDIHGDPQVDDDYSDITHWMPLPEAPKEAA